MIDWHMGEKVNVPLWHVMLQAAGGNPWLAEQIEREIGDLPDPILNAVLVAAHGDVIAAREIARNVSAKWWRRFLVDAEARATADRMQE